MSHATFELPYDPFGLATLTFMKVQCVVCPVEFWIPDTHVGPYTCSKECTDGKKESINVTAEQNEALGSPGSE